jgi:hypothetical protein
MGKIVFNVGEGGLGRPLPNNDHITGFLADSAALPTGTGGGFASNDRIKKVASLEQAEALGIVDTHADETVATGGSVQITAAGASGDVWTIAITPVNADTVTLGTYTEKTGDTPALIAAGLEAAIDALTATHGYSASSTTDTVNLTAAPKQGIALNGAGLTGTSSGAGTTSVTQFTSGVASDIAHIHYHVSEFFRIQPKGILYIGIYDENAGTYDGTNITNILDFADGEIRQVMVYLKATFASSMITATQSVVNINAGEDQPLNVLIGADLSATTISGVINLRALASDRVSGILGEDGGAEGKRLTGVLGRSITSLGASTGAVALAAVSDSIGWIQKFPMAGLELNVINFATGEAVKGQPRAIIEDLSQTKGWVLLKKEKGLENSYHEDSPVANLITSDFAYIENGRTIDKARRNIRAQLVPFINSPLFVDPTSGQLTEFTISVFTNQANQALDPMVTDLELSGFSVVIDPSQNVLASSEIVLTVTLVPVGVARQITINIGFGVITS